MGKSIKEKAQRNKVNRPNEVDHNAWKNSEDKGGAITIGLEINGKAER